MTNGGTGPFFGKIVLVTDGRGPMPPSVVLVDPADPSNMTVLLDNFFGRQFNSLNDVKIHPKTGRIFFTDVECVSATFIVLRPVLLIGGFRYGFLLQFRPAPLLPNQVYRFDPVTGSVRVVADSFYRSDGIAFSPDGSTAFMCVLLVHGNPCELTTLNIVAPTPD